MTELKNVEQELSRFNTRLLAAAAFVLFGREVMLMAPMSVQSFAAPEPGTRLDFWPVAATEWLVTAAVILWIIAVSLRLRSKRD